MAIRKGAITKSGRLGVEVVHEVLPDDDPDVVELGPLRRVDAADLIEPAVILAGADSQDARRAAPAGTAIPTC